MAAATEVKKGMEEEKERKSANGHSVDPIRQSVSNSNILNR